MKICGYFITPSMYCTKREGHEKEDGNENHLSFGVWLHLMDIMSQHITV
jgi:hypothetical protein